MTGDEFKAAGIILFDDDWVAGMGALIGCSPRNVRRFASGEKALGGEFAEKVENAVALCIVESPDASAFTAVINNALSRRNLLWLPKF